MNNFRQYLQQLKQQQAQEPQSVKKEVARGGFKEEPGYDDDGGHFDAIMQDLDYAVASQLGPNPSLLLPGSPKGSLTKGDMAKECQNTQQTAVAVSSSSPRCPPPKRPKQVKAGTVFGRVDGTEASSEIAAGIISSDWDAMVVGPGPQRPPSPSWLPETQSPPNKKTGIAVNHSLHHGHDPTCGGPTRDYLEGDSLSRNIPTSGGPTRNSPERNHLKDNHHEIPVANLPEPFIDDELEANFLQAVDINRRMLLGDRRDLLPRLQLAGPNTKVGEALLFIEGSVEAVGHLAYARLRDAITLEPCEGTLDQAILAHCRYDEGGDAAHPGSSLPRMSWHSGMALHVRDVTVLYRDSTDPEAVVLPRPHFIILPHRVLRIHTNHIIID
jgi:hypothetical protein